MNDERERKKKKNLRHLSFAFLIAKKHWMELVLPSIHFSILDPILEISNLID